jgi:hypothetical protein
MAKGQPQGSHTVFFKDKNTPIQYSTFVECFLNFLKNKKVQVFQLRLEVVQLLFQKQVCFFNF